MTNPMATKPLLAFLEAGEIEIRTGPFGTQLKASEYVDKGTPVINVRNIGFGSLRPEKLEYLPEKVASRLHQHRLKSGDVVFGRKGAVERHLLVTADQSGWIQGSDCIRVRIISGSLNPHFLSYCLLLEEHKSWIQSQASHGATMATLNQGIIERIRVPERTPPEQQRIASILSAYDGLIQVNQRRIAILEDTARRLFDEWFVRFRYPGHETVPLIETKLGKVPEGWPIEVVADVVVRRKAGDVYKANDVLGSGSVMVIDQSTDEYLGFHNNGPDHLASPEAPLMIFGDHTCKLRILTRPFSVGPNTIVFGAAGQLPAYYLFGLIQDAVTTREYKRHWSDLSKKPFPIAPVALAQRYKEIVLPMFQQCDTLREVNRNLAIQRDLLLPKLISGEIDVSTVEQTFAEAAE